MVTTAGDSVGENAVISLDDGVLLIMERPEETGVNG